MQSFLFALFKLSVIAAVIVAIVYAITPVAARRYSNKWRYFLWIALSIMLVLPIDMALISAPVVIPVQQQIPVAQPKQEPARIDAANESAILETEPAPISHGAQSVQDQLTIYVPKPDLAKIVFYLWLVGAAGYLAYSLLSYLIAGKSIWRWSRSPDDETFSAYAKIKQAMGINRKIPLLISGRADSPMLIGLFRPAVYLPDAAFTQEQLAHIFAHELTHYKRGDIYIKALLLAARTMHWFNPFVHLMARTASDDIEICCDEAATRGKESNYKGSYATTIVEVIRSAKSRDIILSTSFNGGKRTLKNRIEKLLEPVKVKRGIVVVAAMLLIALAAQGLVACGKNPNASMVTGSKIYPMQLSQEQKDVLDMAGNNNAIDIYNYNIHDDFQTLLVTRELYKDGELLSDSTFTSSIHDRTGMISIAFDSKTGSLVLSHKNGGATSSSQSMIEEEVVDSGYSSGKTWLQEETPVIDDEEIVLMITVYEDGDAMSIFNTEFYQEYPERLADYDYVHVVKCMFTSQMGDELYEDSEEDHVDSEIIAD